MENSGIRLEEYAQREARNLIDETVFNGFGHALYRLFTTFHERYNAVIKLYGAASSHPDEPRCYREIRNAKKTTMVKLIIVAY